MNSRKIIRLRWLRGLGNSISRCARMCRMDRKTAAHYLDDAVPLHKDNQPRTYRTRKDPIEPFWPEIQAMLDQDKELKPYAIFEYLKDKHQGSFDPSYKRTLERRIAQWRIDHQIEKEVTFDQLHRPGDVLAIDFTDMNSLAITITGDRFEHMAFHSVLTYSNWEYAQVCFSESFEAVADGIQNSFLAIGGVTDRVRCDSLTAAVNNLSVDKQFQANFRALLNHFGTTGQRINVRSPNENGDCESQHGHFKDYVDQRLRLRGSRDFDSVDQYKVFLQECIVKRNEPRREAFKHEQRELDSLPATMFPTYTEVDVRVTSNSIITVKQNRYAVPSCFIGMKVAVRIQADTIELWYLSKQQLQMPRLIGKGKEYIDFRYVIDSLVKKPNAFAAYRYREHMYPTLEFRKAFDSLVNRFAEPRGIRLYLKLLQAAKQHGLSPLENLLAEINSDSSSLTPATIAATLKALDSTRSGAVEIDVHVEAPELNDYDELLEHKEVLNEPANQLTKPTIQGIDGDSNDACTQPSRTGFPFETSAVADDASGGAEPCRASSQRAVEPLGVLGRADDDGVPEANGESCSRPSETFAVGTMQDLGANRLESNSALNTSTDGPAADRRVSETDEQRAAVRTPRLGEDVASEGPRRSTDPRWPHGVLRSLLVVDSTSAAGEEGTTTTADAEQAWTYLGVGDRRPWLCSADSRGDGSVVYTDFGSVRADKYFAEQQSSVFEMGEHLQGPDDDSRRDRSAGPPQRDSGVECSQLSIGRGSQGPGATINDFQQETFEWGKLIVAKVEI